MAKNLPFRPPVKTIKLPTAFLDSLYRKKLTGAEFRVFLAVFRVIRGCPDPGLEKDMAYISLAKLQEMTGLKKRTVQKALSKLNEEGLMTRAPGGGGRYESLVALRMER